ncbi:hypothetical protein AAG906_017285 [Vitis piasezkii]
MTIQTPKSVLALIETCTNLQQLKQIHAKSIISSLSYTQFIITKIINSFLSHACLDYATQVFNQTQEPDGFIYNAMIRAYSSSQTPCVAISIYNKMRACQNILGDKYTYPFVFKACASQFAVEKGKEVHGVIVRIGYELDGFLQSSLLNFYMVCGEIGNAQQVFDEFDAKDVVFWNALITGYARQGMVLDSFGVFKEMVEVKEVRPNEGTMMGLIVACIESKNLKLGRAIHGYMMKDMVLREGVKLEAALINLYVKCGYLDGARKLFDEIPEKNTVVWNSLICGYCQIGSLNEVIELLREMHLSNLKPDRFTVSGVLSACAQMGAFNLGNWVHRFAEKKGIWDVFIGTALIDMYAKCGFIGAAREVFDQMNERNVATWNAILSGYASHGQAESAIELFSEMRESGARPDSITFLAVLHACAHSGLVENGKQYFDLMLKYYKIPPRVEHYGCMVDLLGRAGLLQEARELIKMMVVEPNVVVWGALLSACSIHGNIEIGEWAAHHMIKLNAMDGGSYVILANLYASAQRFDRVKAVREMMVEKGICKSRGCSMIEIGDVVHEFVVADKMHPRSEEICSVLDELSKKLKIAGYVPLLALDEEG